MHARDRFCDGPTGTQVPARRTDTDHHRPWPHGPTNASNLVSRSGRTHQLKHAGWRPVRDGTGTTWTSPAGQVVHAPAHHHPPDPLPRGTRLRDPDQLAASDGALLRLPSWADDDPPDDSCDGGEPLNRAASATGTTRHGWSDEPPF